jgi:hypothetical protein
MSPVAYAQQSCATVKANCWEKVNVPCQSKWCDNISNLGVSNLPPCTNGNNGQPVKYASIVQASSWERCKAAAGSTNLCGEIYDVCSIVWIYGDTNCSIPCLPNSTFGLYVCRFDPNQYVVSQCPTGTDPGPQ